MSRMIDGVVNWISSSSPKAFSSLAIGALLNLCHVLNIFISNLDGNIESMLARFKGAVKMNVCIQNMVQNSLSDWLYELKCIFA